MPKILPLASKHPMSHHRASVSKKVRFSSAHFFYLPELSEAENFARFGATSNRNAHGHNYELEVSVEGSIDPETGMVINLKDLSPMLKKIVVEPLDFKNLNLDIAFFKDHFPTLENLAIWLWPQLEKEIREANLTLKHVRIYEADDLFVDYYGGALAA